MKIQLLPIGIILLMSMIGAKALAHDIQVQNAHGITIYYNYINDGKELEVTTNNNLYDSYKGDVVIPEEVTFMNRTRKVTSIGEYAFCNCYDLTSITIPVSITNINLSAFIDCPLSNIIVEEGNPTYDSRDNCNAIIKTADNELLVGCENTIIPNSITSIGSFSFSNCFNLTSITIPSSVNMIGISAFSDCSWLSSVIILGNITSIGDKIFQGCSSLTSITIPNSVSSIGNETFRGCKNLTKIMFPNSLTSIGEGAFNECSGLETIIIPNGVTSINDDTFHGCTSLNSITIPNSVSTIGESAFMGCRNLNSVSIPNCVKTIGKSAFNECSSLISVTIPNSVSSIGDYAFSGCSNLKTLSIGNGLTDIGYGAFRKCEALTSVSITDIAAWCNIDFGDYSSDWYGVLTNQISNPLFFAQHLYVNDEEIIDLVIPNNVTMISSGAFIGCSLNSVTIPSGVSYIGSQAFNYADIPTIISRMENPFSFNEKVFSDNTINNATLYVPMGTIDRYKTTEGWNSFVFIEEETDNIEKYIMGDANNDGVVNAADIVEVINAINGKASEKFSLSNSDLNNNGEADVYDIESIVNIIMGE